MMHALKDIDNISQMLLPDDEFFPRSPTREMQIHFRSYEKKSFYSEKHKKKKNEEKISSSEDNKWYTLIAP